MFEKQLRKYPRVAAAKGKIAVALMGTTALISLAYMGCAYAPIVKVGANSTTYTYRDIEEVYSFGNQIAELSGNKPIENRASVYQSLMAAAVEKEILEARKAPVVDKDKATAYVISQSPYAGLLMKEKEKIGADRFFKLFISPVISDKDFGMYYLNRDPKRGVAAEALKAAQAGGLQAAAEKAGSPINRASIPINADSAQLAAEASKYIGALLPRLVEDNTGYAIMQPQEVTQTHVTADVVFIAKMPVVEFIEKELKDAKIPVNDRFYSWFKVKDLRKAGGILAKNEAAKAGIKQ